MATRFTDRQIKSLLRQSEVGRHAIGNGLYFRVSKEGTGFWEVRYSVNGKRRQMTLGRYPDMSLADANLETAKAKQEVRQGIDPLAERKRSEAPQYRTVNDLAEDWLKDCARRLKYPEIPKRVYEKDIAPTIGELSIGDVNPRDIRALISEIATSGRPTIANDALMYCKQLFRHGVKLDLRTSNPAEAFNTSDAGGVEKSRTRALSVEELSDVFVCFRENSDQFTRDNYLAVALLLVLGVRKGELIAACWDEFDLEAGLWELPEERSKTGAAITIPLPQLVVEWLEELSVRACGSEFLFPNRRASKRFGHVSPDTLNAAIKKLFNEKKLKVPHFTVHDLRRTCRSLMASIGIPGHVAERCMNHKLKGVEGIYDRYDYLDERRDALEKISALINPVV